jgi:molecular chaperone DnaJ
MGGGFGGADPFSDLGDIFGDIFGDILGGGGRRRRSGGRQRGRPGDDLQMVVDVTFEDAAFGAEKVISVQRKLKCETCDGSGGKNGSKPVNCDYCGGAGEVRRQQGFFTIASACPKCQGSGQTIAEPCGSCSGAGTKRKKTDLSVSIPAGIGEGQRLKLSGEGDEGQQGGPAGDLYIVIQVEKHEFFEREEFDVLLTVPVSFSQAALGADLEVPTLHGKVSLKVPAGTQSGKKFRLKGKGIQRLGGYGLGDQIITLQLETPAKLSSEQRDLFKRLAELEQNQSNPLSRGFFDRVKDLFH